MLLPAFALFQACSWLAPATQIPSYIHIDAITVTSDYPSQGSNSSKITDAWVYVNSQKIGTFQLPATIPVLSDGLCNVVIDPGIKVNGIAASRKPYAFYTQAIQNLTLKRGEKLTVAAAVKYINATTFAWKEDFETVGISVNKSPFAQFTVDTSMVKVSNTSNVFEGNSCGAVYLDNAHQYFEGTSSSAFSLPINGDPTFLELNYKTNNSFKVGIYATGVGSTIPLPVLTVNPSSEWNKIYVDLSSVTKFAPSPSYTIYFSMERDANVSQATLYVDNIKLVY